MSPLAQAPARWKTSSPSLPRTCPFAPLATGSGTWSSSVTCTPTRPRTRRLGVTTTVSGEGWNGPRAAPLHPSNAAGRVLGFTQVAPGLAGAAEAGKDGWQGVVGMVAHGCFSSLSRRADRQGRPGLRLHCHQDDCGKRKVGVKPCLCWRCVHVDQGLNRPLMPEHPPGQGNP